MKKLLTFILITVSLSSNAFFNNTNNSLINDGQLEDNGIFSYNPYNFHDPRWYLKEMINVIDEVDEKFNDKESSKGYLYASYSDKNFPVADISVIRN